MPGTASRPDPQGRSRFTNPIETALTAAVPIKVSTTLRERFAPHPVIVTTLTNDWQPGYIPTASTYGYGIYQDVIAATSAGCLETLIETISRRLETLRNQNRVRSHEK